MSVYGVAFRTSSRYRLAGMTGSMDIGMRMRALVADARG